LYHDCHAEVYHERKGETVEKEETKYGPPLKGKRDLQKRNMGKQERSRKVCGKDGVFPGKAVVWGGLNEKGRKPNRRAMPGIQIKMSETT